MPKLDENALRRPDFAPGSPVALADGQSWQLRRPLVRFVPAETDEGFEVRLSLAGDDRYPDLLSAHDAAEAAIRAAMAGPDRDDATASILGMLKAELALARHLLLANYALDSRQVAELLQFGLEDADGVRIRSEVMAVARGEGPAGGDELVGAAAAGGREGLE